MKELKINGFQVLIYPKDDLNGRFINQTLKENRVKAYNHYSKEDEVYHNGQGKMIKMLSVDWSKENVLIYR